MKNRIITGLLPGLAAAVTVFIYLSIWGDSYAGLVIAGGVGAAIGLVANKVLF